MTAPSDSRNDEYIAVIDQNEVTEEVRNIAVNYDPINRSGHEGFHVTDENKLRIDDAKVMREHKLIEKKIPNDAIRIVPLPSETGQLVHQSGDNGFRLYNLPAPVDGSVIGLLGRNGIGKTTALRILAGEIVPNFGTAERISWDQAVNSFRGTTLQTHLEQLRDGVIRTSVKNQRIRSGGLSGDESVRQRLSYEPSGSEELVDALDLQSLLSRSLDDLSGGERQRVAIVATLLEDADLYLFDEPSSFLDVDQRTTVAKVIKDHVRNTDTAALIVEHDLTTLDLLSDHIHVLFGDQGGFGVVSQRLSPRAGINQFLSGYLTNENVQIRPTAIEFPPATEREYTEQSPVFEYSALEKEFSGFTMGVDSGQVYPGESIGIVGANGLGKTTFVKLLAGSIAPDQGATPENLAVSYKPQYISPDGPGTVRDLFDGIATPDSQHFKTRIEEPFDLHSLYDRQRSSLSGGELQRVGVALCLARDADLYLIDEPSAFLDVDRRVSLADEIRRFCTRTDRPVLVVDHDLFVIDRVADRLVVFDGRPGEQGHASSPQSLRAGMNSFLASLNITFRRDGQTNRPRINNPGSQLDREQKANGEYYYE